MSQKKVRLTSVTIFNIYFITQNIVYNKENSPDILSST